MNDILSSLKPDAYSLHYSIGATGPEPIRTYYVDPYGDDPYEFSDSPDFEQYRTVGFTNGGNGALRWTLGEHFAFETEIGLNRSDLYAFRVDSDCSDLDPIQDYKECLNSPRHISELRAGAAGSLFVTTNHDIRKTALELGGTVREYALFTPVRGDPYTDAQVSGRLGLRVPLTSGHHPIALSIQGEAGINGAGRLACKAMQEAIFTSLDLEDEYSIYTTSLHPPIFGLLHLGILWE